MMINYEQLQGKNRRVLGGGFLVVWVWVFLLVWEGPSFLDELCPAGIFNY